MDKVSHPVLHEGLTGCFCYIVILAGIFCNGLMWMRSDASYSEAFLEGFSSPPRFLGTSPFVVWTSRGSAGWTMPRPWSWFGANCWLLSPLSSCSSGSLTTSDSICGGLPRGVAVALGTAPMAFADIGRNRRTSLVAYDASLAGFPVHSSPTWEYEAPSGPLRVTGQNRRLVQCSLFVEKTTIILFSTRIDAQRLATNTSALFLTESQCK